jgi:hypothetical protein
MMMKGFANQLSSSRAAVGRIGCGDLRTSASFQKSFVKEACRFSVEGRLHSATAPMTAGLWAAVRAAICLGLLNALPWRVESMEQALFMRAPTAEPPAQCMMGAERRVINRRGISLEPLELASSKKIMPMPRLPSKQVFGIKRPGSASRSGVKRLGSASRSASPSPSLASQPNMETDAAKLSEITRKKAEERDPRMSWASRSQVDMEQQRVLGRMYASIRVVHICEFRESGGPAVSSHC